MITLARSGRSRFATCLAALGASLALAGGVVAGAPATEAASAPKVLQLPMRTDGPKSLDPAQGSTQYDNIAVSLHYETLLTFSYAKPSELEPLLLAEMPTTKDGGLTWSFKLKPGVVFQDDACFGGAGGGGKGRAIKSDDVFFSLKRIADRRNGLKNWWLLDGAIAGFNDFKDAQNIALESANLEEAVTKVRAQAHEAAREAGADPQRAATIADGAVQRLTPLLSKARWGTFDYDAPVEGFIKVSDSEFQIKLTKPVFRFLYTLAQFQTSIVAREAVEKYGLKDFGAVAVGTGPFALERWEPKQYLHAKKNPTYHDVRYPARDQWTEREDRRKRMDRAAGQKVPFVDRIEFTMFTQDQPMWLEFNSGNLGYIEVPGEYFEKAFDKRTKELNAEMTGKGVTAHSDQLLDFIFIGFNMLDPVVGGLDPDKKALRQAISLACDQNEINDVIYNGINVVYDGPIPPALDGHPAGGKALKNYRGPDLDAAKAKLKEAGWPEGKNAKTGEQLVLRYYTDVSVRNTQTAELYKRQLARVGVRLEPVQLDFSTLIENVNNRKAQLFGFAWGSDYPDAENNLALFYTPNMSPGSNHYNYSRAEFDRLYEQILVMNPKESDAVRAERAKLYEQMRDMLIEDCPFVGGMGRTRFYLMAPWITNCRPTERTWSWIKYLDVDDSKRAR